ncbi:hypothetical protein ONE63_010664 [Megalurothrips usitatus]|uniref:Uncharacterized protein n=1 Tax=Megalurothrips usitatus TaxID=439358 RepID=A0AAV7XHG1_9NEOP|nr:hypothetical protein ONE63_010664 [Megalurothrips usitatus]
MPAGGRPAPKAGRWRASLRVRERRRDTWANTTRVTFRRRRPKPRTFPRVRHARQQTRRCRPPRRGQRQARTAFLIHSFIHSFIHLLIRWFRCGRRLLLQETAYKDSIWGIVRDADIVYPKKNELGYKISCIKIIDQRKDGKNGVTKVKEGGLGSNFVKLRFHSERGHSLNWVVQIYGH